MVKISKEFAKLATLKSRRYALRASLNACYGCVFQGEQAILMQEAELEVMEFEMQELDRKIRKAERRYARSK